MTCVMTDLTTSDGIAYSYCGHAGCDLGVNGDGRVMCSGRYCSDRGAYEPPEWAYWNGEEDYPR